MNERPNLIFIFADAFRASAVGGSPGADPTTTPNLNALASQGVTMTHAVSNYPICSPYRAMLMTGQYSFRNGVTGNCCSMPGCEQNYLRPESRTFTDALSGAGYGVGYVGKWHLEKPVAPYIGPPDSKGHYWNEFTPPERRHGVGFWCAYNTYDNHFQPQYWITGMPRNQRHRVVKWSPRFETDVALAFLQNENEQFRPEDNPFALFLSFNPPHTPFEQVPADLVRPYAGMTPEQLLVRKNVQLGDRTLPTRIARTYASNYFAMIDGIDEQVGRLTETLDQLNLSNNTLVVFTSDHGEMMGSQCLMYKGYAYDESARVPFIARWPGHIPAGCTSNALLGAPDVMPTLLDTMGLAEHTPAGVEGTSLAGALKGDAEARSPDSVFLFNVADGWRGVRTARHTYYTDLKGLARAVLFDNMADPFQTENIAMTQPELAEQLHLRTMQWMDSTGDFSHRSAFKKSA